MDHADAVPLSFTQRARLLAECLPVVFFSVALVFVVTLLDDITGARPSLYLILFLAIVILVAGWAALNRIRDLAAGVALLHEDVLEPSWRSRGASSNPFHGRFTQLGRMRLSSSAYGQGQHGLRYRVAYSPASKIVWRLESMP